MYASAFLGFHFCVVSMAIYTPIYSNLKPLFALRGPRRICKGYITIYVTGMGYGSVGWIKLAQNTIQKAAVANTSVC
jgi:hypothetical protein